MRVLLVDDNPDALSMSSLLFAAEGHIVTMATNPTEALGHAAATRPEVVVLDIGMPGMNGFELARAIRALNQKPRPLIIAVSGYTQDGHIKRGIEAGFDFHYPKTIDPNVILATVREHAARVSKTALDDPSGKPH
jgi:two-component system CheB/CheR fusion protein